MILELFLRNPKQVFTRSQIIDKLWEIDKLIQAGDKTIRTHITNLRYKLKSVGMSVDCIETVYGIGYRLRDEKDRSKQLNI
jgi:DNA-binding response OmpR family regulator